jgi:hypothetical protein
MRVLKRYIAQQARSDLDRKILFIGGPRQVGKTTFSLHVRPKKERKYLNWDIMAHRSAILDGELGTEPLLILDEIHKYRRWRGLLKGLYDAIQAQETHKREILVTGSARLDYYRFGGDSLQGRYHYLRLLPLSYSEIHGKTHSDLERLFKFTGFPEPFLSQSEVELKRWSREYRARLVREDLRDLESTQDLGSVELLFGRLPACIGSPLSINSLREDLQVSHRTLSKWLNILERLYAFFRIPPFQGAKIRAVKKEQKAYLFDWSPIQDESVRFENLIAFHLLKHVYWLQDARGQDIDLRYFRDSDAREVDFVLLENEKPTLFVECKYSQTTISPHLKYLHARYPKAQAIQVHYAGEKDYRSAEGIVVQPAWKFLKTIL